MQDTDLLSTKSPENPFVLNNNRPSSINRRTFFRWPLSSIATLTLASGSARAHPCETAPAFLVRGPLRDELPDILNTLSDQEIQDYLVGLDPSFQAIASLPLPEGPPFVQPVINPEERQNIIVTIDDTVDNLIDDLPQDKRPSAQEAKAIKAAAEKNVFSFLRANKREIANLNAFVVPANLAALPTLRLVGDTFVMVDASESNLLVASPLCNVNQDPKQKSFDKLLGIGEIVLGIIAFVVGLAGIKMPNVGADKIAPRLATLIKSNEFRAIFTGVVEVLKREGATLGEKVAAVFGFLKTLWNAGLLKDILIDVFANLNFFDLAVTIASIVAIFLTGGTAVLAKAALALLVLVVAVAKGADRYFKAQEGT